MNAPMCWPPRRARLPGAEPHVGCDPSSRFIILPDLRDQAIHVTVALLAAGILPSGMSVTSTARPFIADSHRGILAKSVYKNVRTLAKVSFLQDFLPPAAASLITSRISSAYKRHGKILEQVLAVGANAFPNVIGHSNVKCAFGQVKDIDVIIQDDNKKHVYILELKRNASQLDGEALISLENRLTSIEKNALKLHLLKNFTGDVSVLALTRYGPAVNVGSARKTLPISDFANRIDPELGLFIEEVDAYFQFCLCRELEPQARQISAEIERVLASDRVATTGDERPVAFPEVKSVFIGKSGVRSHPWDAFV